MGFAYAGFLCGIEFIWEVMAHAPFPELAMAYYNFDVLPVLTQPPDVNLCEYAKAILKRFENRSLEHKTFQVAMDGSQKLPQRLLKTARKILPQKMYVIPFAVACWMRYATRIDAEGKAILVQDPLAERFSAIAVAAKGNFTDPVVSHLRRLLVAQDTEATLAYINEF